MMISIVRYNCDKCIEWDSFIKESKNGTFMLSRRYVEYHSDRFTDYSLMIYNDNSLIAVVPASKHGNEIRSHGGLTYGGIITNKKMTAQKMLEVFDAILTYLRGDSIRSFIYKRVPAIYHKYPSDEDVYALFRNNAELYRRDISTTIFLQDAIRFNERRRRNVKKAIKEDLSFQESNDYCGYMNMLTEVLETQHGVKPVHTSDEIQKLANLFPENIKLYVALKDNKIVAGTVLYINESVVHAQYIANSQEGKQCGALDFVFDNLITVVYKDKLYFDFGISTEDSGRYLNEGLIEQKQEFGGRGIIYDHYRIQL